MGFTCVYVLFLKIKFTFSDIMKLALSVPAILALMLEGVQRIKADEGVGMMSDSPCSVRSHVNTFQILSLLW